MANAIDTNIPAFFISGWDSKPDPTSVHAVTIIGNVRRLYDREDVYVVQMEPHLPLGTDFGLGEVPEAFLGYAIVGRAFQGGSIVEWLGATESPHFPIYVSTIASLEALASQYLTVEHIGATDRAIAYRTIEQARGYGSHDEKER